MSSASNRKISSWLGIFLRPGTEFKKVLQEGAGNSAFFFMVICGFVLLQSIFDLNNMGDTFHLGQLMSFSLVFGPAAGLIFSAIIALLLMNTGCLFDEHHKSKFSDRPYDPSYFFFLILIWKKWSIAFPLAVILFLGARFFEIWNYPVLNSIRRLWSGLCCKVDYYLGFISRGRSTYGQVFSGVGAAMGSIVLLSILMIFEYRFIEAKNFMSAGKPVEDYFSILFSMGFPILKIMLAGWFIYSLARMQEAAFKINFSVSLVCSILAVGLSAALFWFLTLWLTALSLPPKLF